MILCVDRISKHIILYFAFFSISPGAHPVLHLFPYTTLFRSSTAMGRHSSARRKGATIYPPFRGRGSEPRPDRKSTRLNSSHPSISYAVFCLKKKNTRHPRVWTPAPAISVSQSNLDRRVLAML